MINREETEEMLNRLKEMYKDNILISYILNTIEVTEYDKVNSAWKILSNTRIVSIMQFEDRKSLLESIINGDEEAYKNICSLVRRVYGEDAEEILLERPELSMDDIPNFDIFDEQIGEIIGYGGVHTFLTYYMSSEPIITEMVQNPALIRYYKEFEILTEGYFPPSAIGLEDRLLAFGRHRELIRAIVESKDKEKYKENLLLMLRDEEGYPMISGYYNGMQLFNPNADLKVDSLEGLLEYRKRREEVLQRYIDEATNNPNVVDLIHKIIIFKHFGIIKDSAGQYNAYDHKKFLQDYLQFNKTELREDEVDLIEIYAILEDIKSPELLLQIDRELSSRDDVVTPLRMKAIDTKVVENYKSEYMDSLIKLEQARKMAEDPESESYRYICKKNGDICYPDHMKCSSDNSVRYKDYIVQKDGVCLTQYQGANGEEITKKKTKGNRNDIIESYEIKNMLIVPNDGSTPYRRDFQVTLKNGELYEYFWPTHDENERYGLRKQEFYVKSERHSYSHETYSYTYTTPISGEDDEYFMHKIQTDDEGRIERAGWIRTRCNANQTVEERFLDTGKDEDGRFIDSVIKWRDSIEGYLKSVVKEIEKANDEKQEDSYFKVVPQYDPNEVEFEEGDVEGFVLYGVNSNQLCISMQRGGVTSEQLSKNKLFDGKLNAKMDFTGGVKAQIHIEKYLEGGVSSRSFYYSCTNMNNHYNKIGLGISDIDPNAIVGFFSSHDAMTSHAIKRLRVSMGRQDRISDIITKQSKAGMHAELATLRYEYDITKIRPRYCRR